MQEAKIPDDAKCWDVYKAFHCAVDHSGFSQTNSHRATAVILFDTGEVIITQSSPGPDVRGHYRPLGIVLTTSKELNVFLPDGTPCAKTWLEDGGMQYLVHDLDTCTAVRLDGQWRRAPGKDSWGRETAGSPLTPGVPKRFQYNNRCYIPGPGMRPIAHDKIAVRRPLRSGKYTPEQLEHIHMIVATGQAAMKLSGHDAAVGKRVGEKATADPKVLLNCATWLDVPDHMLPALAQRGCTHFVEEYDYLLTTVG